MVMKSGGSISKKGPVPTVVNKVTLQISVSKRKHHGRVRRKKRRKKMQKKSDSLPRLQMILANNAIMKKTTTLQPNDNKPV